MNNLDQLLTTRQDIWRGTRRPQRKSVSTGCPTLDQRLPDQGWPCGQLIELCPNPLGSGELEILLPLIARQTQRTMPVMLITPPWIPCPQTLHNAGVDLEHCLILRGDKHALWATEQALKSGLCGAVIVWLSSQRVTEAAIRRLQLACENGPAPLFIVATQQAHSVLIKHAIKIFIEPGPTVQIASLSLDGPTPSMTFTRSD